MVTCTDTAILCGNFPEACYARYGATAVRNPAHHEIVSGSHEVLKQTAVEKVGPKLGLR